VLKQQQELIAKGAKIKADGVMGPATQAAIKQFAAAPSAGAGRGFVNPTAAPAAAPATTAAKPAAAPATTAAKPPAAPAAKLPAPQTGAAGQAARAAQVNAIVDKRVQQSADRNVAQSAASVAPVTGGGPKVDRSTFESQEISRMRFLAGLNKD
jgi:peptidoglycan hydrolase-like protein with peptidoglycan-binding domain